MPTPNQRISVTQAYNDESVINQIRKLKRDKQEKLIAGPGVNISEQNVISTQSAAPNWGQIGGDIQDQTDLQTALAAKADGSDLTALDGRVTEAEGDIAELQSDVGDAVTDAVAGATTSSSQYIQKIIFTKKDGSTFDIASAPINYHTPATDPTAKTEGISRYGVGVALAGKQDAGNYATQTDLQQGLATREPLLSDAQHAAVNSGITSGGVSNIAKSRRAGTTATCRVTASGVYEGQWHNLNFDASQGDILGSDDVFVLNQYGVQARKSGIYLLTLNLGNDQNIYFYGGLGVDNNIRMQNLVEGRYAHLNFVVHADAYQNLTAFAYGIGTTATMNPSGYGALHVMQVTLLRED